MWLSSRIIYKYRVKEEYNREKDIRKFIKVTIINLVYRNKNKK